MALTLQNEINEGEIESLKKIFTGKNLRMAQ